MKTGLACVIHFQETRERIREHARRTRRPLEIRAETRRLEARRKVNIFELMTEGEIARPWEVAPGLMKQ